MSSRVAAVLGAPLVAALLGVALLAAAPVSPARAATPAAPTATPAAPIAGERFTVTGTFGSTAGRAVDLQARQGGRWVTIASRRTGTKGAYAFTTSTRRERVVLRVRSRATGTTTSSRSVRTVRDRAMLKLSGSGTTAAARVTATPARPGRRVVLERHDSQGTWSRLGHSRAQDTSGRTTFALTGLTQKPSTHRARVLEWKGAARLTSGWVTFSPAIFEPTDLGTHVLRIETDDEHAVITKQEYVGATMTVDGAPAQALTIRGRGNSTWAFAKKPYRLKLGTKDDLLGLPEERDWVLLANYGDRSLLRNTAALDLGAQTGLAWTPRHRPVELFLNGEYRGAYLLAEHVEADGQRVDKTTNLFELDERLEQDEEAEGEDLGFRTTRGTPVVHQDLVAETPEAKAAIATAINDFETALATHDFDAYDHLIDVDSFVDFYLVTELFKGIDADCYTSCFFTWKSGGPITMGPLWDFDHSAGYGPGQLLGQYLDSPSGWWANGLDDYVNPKRPHPQFPWLKHLWATEEFRDLVAARWDALAPTIDAVPTGLAAQAAVLGVAATNDFERWSGDPQRQADQQHAPSHAGEVAFLRTWLTQRIAWLDDQLDDPPAP